MSNSSRTVLYTGVTNSIIYRTGQHKNGECHFTGRYKCYDLVYYEEYKDIEIAIKREKQLKRWRRDWKIELIKKMNPLMKDLYPDLLKD